VGKPRTWTADEITFAGEVADQVAQALHNHERKRAEEELRKEKAFTEAALDAQLDTFFVFEPLTGKAIRWNDRFRRISGYSDEEISSLKAPESYHNEEDLKKARPILEKISKEGQGTVELSLISKDGTHIPTEYNASPLRDDAGDPKYVIAIGRDITERKQVEEALRRYEHIISASSDLIAFIDAEDIYQAVNVAYLEAFGKTKEEFIGHSVAEIFGTEVFETRIRPHLDHCLSGKVSPYQHWLDLPKLGRRYFDVQHDPFYDADGSISGIAVNARDITERKRAETEREALYRRLVDASRQAGKAEIATGVLHNVGNVLNSLNVSATLVTDKLRESKIANLRKVSQWLQDQADDLGTFLTEDEKGKQLPAYLAALAEHLSSERQAILNEFKSISDNIQHIKQIVVRQQSYASDSGVTEPTVITGLIEDALSMNISNRHGIEVVREYDDIPPVIVDKHRLLQIIVNLVRNAKQAINEYRTDDKRLTLRVKLTDHERLRIEVVDNGVGIAAGNLTRVFECGFTTKEDGHGFGLHVSATTAKDMNSSLTCHSGGPGTGTTFALELPFNVAEKAT
jgi:PAS domain S-box-containing protein